MGTKRARIALYAVAAANVVLIVATLPRPPALTGWGTLIVCGGSVWLAYRENPAKFHERVGGRQAAVMVAAPLAVVGALATLAALHLY
jgi:hypothetical protein